MAAISVCTSVHQLPCDRIHKRFALKILDEEENIRNTLEYLTASMIIPLPPDSLAPERRFQGLCAKPYHGHPQGCPNYGRKEGCPPHLPLLDEVFDLEKETYLIYTEFPVGEFAERMLTMHPEWAGQPRQLYNPRRWQPTARKDHRSELERFLATYPDTQVNTAPEAHGLDVSKIMAEYAGITLAWDWPPIDGEKSRSFIVSVGGYLKE